MTTLRTLISSAADSQASGRQIGYRAARIVRRVLAAFKTVVPAVVLLMYASDSVSAADSVYGQHQSVVYVGNSRTEGGDGNFYRVVCRTVVNIYVKGPLFPDRTNIGTGTVEALAQAAPGDCTVRPLTGPSAMPLGEGR